MMLSTYDLMKASKLNLYLKSIEKQVDKETFCFIRCEYCDGSGLDGVWTNADGSHGWDGNSHCQKCKGLGYKSNGENKYQITDAVFICHNCGGKGCALCKNKGLTDWVTNAMRKGID